MGLHSLLNYIPPGPLFIWVQIISQIKKQEEKGDAIPAKLTTTIKNIEKKVHNNINKDLISGFYNYLASIDTSESYQNGLLKVIIRFAEFLGPNVTFYQIQNKEQILKFLDLKKKIESEDPDKK